MARETIYTMSPEGVHRAAEVLQAVSDAPKNIEAILRTQQVSQATLARALGVNYKTLWRWLNRENAPSPTSALRLAEDAKKPRGQ